MIPTGIERGSACDRRWTTGGRREGPIRGRSRGSAPRRSRCLPGRGVDADEAGSRRGQSVPGARDLERGGGDSEELARLLIVKAFWPASLGEGRGTEAEELEARESGEEAAAMAIRLGRPDLASAALDGVGQFFQDRGWLRPVEPARRPAARSCRVAHRPRRARRHLRDGVVVRTTLGGTGTPSATRPGGRCDARDGDLGALLPGLAGGGPLPPRCVGDVLRGRRPIADLLGDRKAQPPGTPRTTSEPPPTSGDPRGAGRGRSDPGRDLVARRRGGATLRGPRRLEGVPPDPPRRLRRSSSGARPAADTLARVRARDRPRGSV